MPTRPPGFLLHRKEERKGKEVKEIVKRILTVLVVALVMTALIVVEIAPAFAAAPFNASGKNPSGHKVAHFSQNPND